jgi:SAM-dependent methyltransferase
MPVDPIRPAYDALGSDEFYRRSGATYRNPHESTVSALVEHVVAIWPIDVTDVLDLACGSGEVTLALLRCEGVRSIHGIDPYTGAAYTGRTGATAEALTFADIAGGALERRDWSTIFCSFALHLAETSRLAVLCHRLAEISPSLVVITPHKRPVIDPSWGWSLRDEVVRSRVRARWYARTTGARGCGPPIGPQPEANRHSESGDVE